MNVALIVEWLDAWRGGAETSTQQFIEHLLELGVRVDVFTRSRVPSRPGLQVHTIPSRSLWPGMGTIAFCHAADRHVRIGRFDVIHALAPSEAADLYQPRGGTYAETFRRNIALRTSSVARRFKALTEAVNRKRRSLLAFERRMMAPASRVEVVALSDYVVRQLTEHYAVAPERIHKVFNGVDPDPTEPAERARNRSDVRAAYGIAEDAPVALSVAHNFRLKGVQSTLAALAHLGRENRIPGLQTLIVGKERLTRWHARVRQLGIEDSVRFTGATQRVRAFYHAADFLVHPTFYDPCSRVVLEARASGLPVITTRFDGAAEIVDEGVSGFVLSDPHDAVKLADLIERALAELRPVGGSRLDGEAGAYGMPGAYGMRRHASELVRLYRAVIERKRAR